MTSVFNVSLFRDESEEDHEMSSKEDQMEYTSASDDSAATSDEGDEMVAAGDVTKGEHRRFEMQKDKEIAAT